MLQTLMTIASLVVLTGAILTSALVSAKAALQRAVVAKTQTAMTDGVSEFTFWAQQLVAKNGTEADWQAQPTPTIVWPMCAATANCAFIATIRWKVTGATVVARASDSAGEAVSVVRNMAQAVDEQRVSATIDVELSDATGRRVYGGRTEEVTARVFDAQPYVVVTGVRDLSSDVGIVRDSEGDSGGAPASPGADVNQTPSVDRPAALTQTIITATIDCANTAGFDEANPNSRADDGSRLIDYTLRPGGAQAWSHQLPCTPTYAISSAPASAKNYAPPVGATYQITNSDENEIWEKGDQSSASFPR